MTTDKSTLCWRRYTRSYHLNSIATSRAFSVEFGLGSWIEPKYNMTDYYSNQIEVIYTYVCTALLMNIINALLIKKINIFLYRGTCYKLLKVSSVKKGSLIVYLQTFNCLLKTSIQNFLLLWYLKFYYQGFKICLFSFLFVLLTAIWIQAQLSFHIVHDRKYITLKTN